MELKQVSNIEQPEYVTKSKMNQKILQKNKPSNWLKAGITGFIFSAIINEKKTLAVSETLILGGLTTKIRVPEYALITKKISILIMCVTIIRAIVACIKKKSMEDAEKKQIKITLVGLFILAIILLVPYMCYRIQDLLGVIDYDFSF